MAFGGILHALHKKHDCPHSNRQVFLQIPTPIHMKKCKRFELHRLSPKIRSWLLFPSPSKSRTLFIPNLAEQAVGTIPRQHRVIVISAEHGEGASAAIQRQVTTRGQDIFNAGEPGDETIL